MSMGDKPFNVDDNLNNSVIKKKIRAQNILGLDDANNVETYMLCLALGVNKGERTRSKSSIAWVRPSSMGEENLAYINAVALNELLKTNQENLITDDKVVYEIIEEYVNTGLKVIDEMVDDTGEYDKEEFSLELLSMLDDEYDRIMNSNLY